MSSPERELLRAIVLKIDGLEGMGLSTFIAEVKGLLAQPEQPTVTQREAYQRGYAQAERDLKREPLSEDEIKQTTKGMSGFGADMFRLGVRFAEKHLGITGETK
jgi:hypothetical protein